MLEETPTNPLCQSPPLRTAPASKGLKQPPSRPGPAFEPVVPVEARRALAPGLRRLLPPPSSADLTGAHGFASRRWTRRWQAGSSLWGSLCHAAWVSSDLPAGLPGVSAPEIREARGPFMTQPQQSTLSHPQTLLVTPVTLIVEWMGTTREQVRREPRTNEPSWRERLSRRQKQRRTSKSELETHRKK